MMRWVDFQLRVSYFNLVCISTFTFSSQIIMHTLIFISSWQDPLEVSAWLHFVLRRGRSGFWRENWRRIAINKCNRCDYVSFLAGNLRQQLKTHSGEKSSKCIQCDFAFVLWGDTLVKTLSLFLLLFFLGGGGAGVIPPTPKKTLMCGNPYSGGGGYYPPPQKKKTGMIKGPNY